MLEPYRMVLINLIASIVVISMLLIYYYRHPKQKIHFLFILILFSLLPLLSLLRAGSYESGDFTIHAYRSIDFYHSLQEGNFFPSWAGELNATYGYPLYIFNYPLPYYIISLFHFLGFSFIASIKILLALDFLFAGIFMYLCSRRLLKNDVAAFIAAIFYQFVPYHLIDLHFKIVIGELTFFMFLPLVFFYLQRLWDRVTLKGFLLTSFSIALLIMSHVSLALFALVLFFTYLLCLVFFAKKKHVLLPTLMAFTLGALATSYLWLTPFFLTRYTIVPKLTFTVNSPSLWEFLYTPWRWGFLFQGPTGELSLLLGYPHVFIIVVLTILLISKKVLPTQKKFILFWLIAFFFSVFLITDYSRSIWETVPFLKTTGGPHRLLLITSFISSLLAGYVTFYLKRKSFLLWLLVGITIFSTILNWGHRRVIPEIADAQLKQQMWQEHIHFYANSRWRDPRNPWFREKPKQHIEIITGSAEIKELTRSSVVHTYLIAAKTNITVQENTLYFPGWKVMTNNKELIANPDQEGRILFKLPKGLQYVTVVYEDIAIYRLLKQISMTTFFALVVLLLLTFSRPLRKSLHSKD